MIKDLYTVTLRLTDGVTEEFYINLNPECPIYKGHFPGRPVVPGVCCISIIKDCAQMVADEKLVFSRIRSCRFLKVLDPSVHKELKVYVRLSFSDGQYVLDAVIKNCKDICVELKAQLTEMIED